MINKILVTGGAGYIGSVATYILLKRGYGVVVLDNLSTGNRGVVDFFSSKFSNKFTFLEVDIRDKSSLESALDKENNIDSVLHYAASCLVNESMENPYMYFENNVAGTNNLLDVITKIGINKLIFSSTCAVYGENQYTPVDEKHQTIPVNPYGESKLMIEKIIDWYSQLKGLKYVVLRYFNVCGASDDGEVGDSKDPSVLMVQNAVRGAMGIEAFKLTCPKVDTTDGTPIRDYINVVDLNEAHIKALDYLDSGGESEVINLGTGTGNSVLEVVKVVEVVTGKNLPREKGQERKGEWAEMYADISKAKSILNWKPERSIEDSVKSLVKWYQKYPRGWKK